MTATDTEAGLMTVPEVQERMKIGRTLIYRLIADRSLPAVRIGRSIRVRAAAVERYLEENPY